MERWRNKIAVVTGASMGIGAAIAKDLIAAGVEVIGLARRKDLIDTLIASLPQDQRSRLTAIKCDITDLNSVNEAFDAILNKFGGIDILVNNAGILVSGLMVDMDPQMINTVLQTNVMGIVYCTQRAFKSMKERNTSGHVVLINSVAGHSVYAGAPTQLPFANIYSPSKFAVTAITDIYRQEFYGLGTKVKVTSISPGVVDTSILVPEAREAMRGRMLDACDVSNAVLYVLSTPAHVQIHELTIKPFGDLM